MLRRALSLFLVLSWLVLAGIDLLEDLDGCSQVELNSYSHRGNLANDILESADSPCAYGTWLPDHHTFHLSVFTPILAPRTSKLHKLHHIYQI